MFLDSLVGDAAWLARYAKTVTGEVREIFDDDEKVFFFDFPVVEK
jgi:hypothetical protein